MKKRTVLDGVVCAIAIAALAAPAWWALRNVFSPEFAFRFVLLGAHMAYLLWLLRGAKSRVGNLTLAAANLPIAAALAVAPLAPTALASLLVLLTALNRTLLHHRRVASILLDGLIAAAGLMFASYLTARGGGLIAGLWGFLLVQSLSALIPPAGQSGESGRSEEAPDPFSRAHRQAQQALLRLVGDGGA